MSDGMAFLTGAAFAGVAVLFMLKGTDANLIPNMPSAPQLPSMATTNPYNPYATQPPMPTPASPNLAPYNNFDQQRLDNDRYRAILDQQRTEIEQLRSQLQSQQMMIERLTAQNQPGSNSLFAGSQPASSLSPAQQQQEENPLLSGLVWALGGMAITVSGGIVVVGALAVLARQQQRPPRTTTYVVPHPYTALPPTMAPRRRTEVIPPQYEERHIDYVD